MKNSARGGDLQQARKADFAGHVNGLIDIAAMDALDTIKIQEDIILLRDQRTERKYVIGEHGIATVPRQLPRSRTLSNLRDL